jgi:hypothetical protein
LRRSAATSQRSASGSYPREHGGHEAIIGPLLYQEIVDEVKREVWQQIVLEFLEDRFGPEAKDLEAQLRDVALDRLRELIVFATKCRSLASFRKRFLSS